MVVNRALWFLERRKPDTGRAKSTPSGQKWKHRHGPLLWDGELVGSADEDWRWMLPSAGEMLEDSVSWQCPSVTIFPAYTAFPNVIF